MQKSYWNMYMAIKNHKVYLLGFCLGYFSKNRFDTGKKIHIVKNLVGRHLQKLHLICKIKIISKEMQFYAFDKKIIWDQMKIKKQFLQTLYSFKNHKRT